ncbi:hypothetical protein [Streptomyces sp. NPDC002853]
MSRCPLHAANGALGSASLQIQGLAVTGGEDGGRANSGGAAAGQENRTCLVRPAVGK